MNQYKGCEKCGYTFWTANERFCESCQQSMIEKQLKKGVSKQLQTIKSAKAKSVLDLALASLGTATTSSKVYSPYTTEQEVLVFTQQTTDEELASYFKLQTSKGKKVFARPAPLTPVHGFFDSRVVDSAAHVRGLAYHIWTKKPKNEILEIVLMPEISHARFSGIITPRSITIGRDNDGATNGKTAITLKTPSSVVGKILSETLIKTYTKENESTFVEVVVPCNKTEMPTVVQVRSGNEPDSGGNDYIPYDVQVKRVHEVTDQTDLVAWQKQVASFSEGDVIYAKSLACHGAVHGVLHKIPVVTTFVPNVGDKLEAGKITPVDYNRVASLVASMFSSQEEFSLSLGLYGWKTLHLVSANFQAGGEEVIAFALYYMLMGGVAACLGEYRHAKGKLVSGFVDSYGSKLSYRNEVFRKAFSDKRFAFQKLFKVWECFLDEDRWPSRSYGGLKWADCTHHTAKLGKAIGGLIKNPSEVKLNAALEVANMLAHCMHNGGLLFTKFGNVSSNGAESIHDIFAHRPVLSRLMELRETETNITLHRERFTFLKTLNRRLPDRLVNYEENRKREEEKEREEARLEKKQNFEKGLIALDTLVKRAVFTVKAVSSYNSANVFETSYVRLKVSTEKGYFSSSVVMNPSALSSEQMESIKEEKAIKVNLGSEPPKMVGDGEYISFTLNAEIPGLETRQLFWEYLEITKLISVTSHFTSTEETGEIETL